jgi:hypothetical protein
VPILAAPRSSQPPRQITLKVTASIPFTPKIYQIRELYGTFPRVHSQPAQDNPCEPLPRATCPKTYSSVRRKCLILRGWFAADSLAQNHMFWAANDRYSTLDDPGAAPAISAADLCIIHAGYVARLDRTLPHRILQGLLPGLLSMAWPRRDGDLPENMPRRSCGIRIVNMDIMIFVWPVTGRLSEKSRPESASER